MGSTYADCKRHNMLDDGQCMEWSCINMKTPRGFKRNPLSRLRVEPWKKPIATIGACTRAAVLICFILLNDRYIDIAANHSHALAAQNDIMAPYVSAPTLTKLVSLLRASCSNAAEPSNCSGSCIPKSFLHSAFKVANSFATRVAAFLDNRAASHRLISPSKLLGSPRRPGRFVRSALLWTCGDTFSARGFEKTEKG